MTNLIGQSLGRYHILEQLGEGGMATVYKAFDTRLEREVAVKVIRRDAFPPNQLERILQRFEREAKSLARLNHPNIVKVHDFGDHDGAPYLVMEYLPGGTLKQHLGQPIPWQQAAKILLPVAEALEYAHEQKMVHRDVKPSNILLTSKGIPLLTDFGVAKLLDLEDGQTLTGTGVGVGTPEYMAPEQWTNKTVPQSDIYGLAVVFYELITGRRPYQADTPAALLLKQANDPLPRPGQFVPGLPDAVERVLLKALAKQVEDRYASMGELAAALEKLAHGSPAPVRTTQAHPIAAYDEHTRDEPPPSPAYTPLPVFRRGAAWLWGLGSLILIALLALVIANLPELYMTSPAPTESETHGPTATATITRTPIATSTTRRTPTATNTILQEPSGEVNTCNLSLCSTSTDDVCIYALNPQNTSLIVTIRFIESLTISPMPAILDVGNNRFSCNLNSNYSDQLYCTGSSVTGDTKLKVYSSDNQLICSGIINIPRYIPPSPTPVLLATTAPTNKPAPTNIPVLPTAPPSTAPPPTAPPSTEPPSTEPPSTEPPSEPSPTAEPPLPTDAG